MPMKLNVGLSRKVGEANYGSRGASVHLELEVESVLVENPDRLQDRIRQMFRLARASVDEELGTASQSDNGDNERGRRRSRGPQPRPATASQVRALWTIAERHDVDLPAMLRERFGAETPANLTITEASRLIDDLNASHRGSNGSRS